MKTVQNMVGGYRQLEANFGTTRTAISTLYKKYLFRKQGLYAYHDAQGDFRAEYQEIEPDGHLILKDDQGTLRRYAFKEVEFILP